MKYWENGFYLEQNKQATRKQITDEQWKELISKCNTQGLSLRSDLNGYPELYKPSVDEKSKQQIRLRELETWFTEIYDNQVKQYERCMRLGLTFDNKYGTISELDRQAEINANEIKNIRNKLNGL